MKGKLIVFDGNDGSGKNTQAKLLVNYLMSLGKVVLFVSFPRYHEFFGQIIKRAKDGEFGDFSKLDPYFASVLYANDRSQLKECLLQFIAAGGYVVCDRYVSANQIHQGGKFDDAVAREKYFRWLEELEYDINGLPRPDVLFYLDVPVESSLELLSQKSKDTLENNRKYLEDSHKCAQELIARQLDKWVHIRCGTSKDTMLKVEDIQKEILVYLRTQQFI